jgi:HK97 family phage major capsid protein
MERLGDLTARMKESAPPGRMAGRFFKALAVARGNLELAAAYAEKQRWVESGTFASIHKSGVAALGSEATIYYAVGQDIQALAAKTSAMRQLPGFRRIPDNVNCVTATTGATAYFGAEGAAAPMSALAFQRSSLTGIRINALSAVTQELAEASDSEMIIAADHARALAEKIDASFFDPENQGSPEVLPKSITADAPQFVSSGSAVTNVDTDLRLLVASMVNGGSNLVNAVWCMSPITGAHLGSLRGSGGSPSYPGIGALGGTLLGLPAITTAGIARAGSPSPGRSYLCLVDASRIWLVDRGITFRASTQATLEMSDVPTGNAVTPTATSQVSMWQTDSIALLSSSHLNWKAVTNSSAAAVLTGVEY